MSVFDTTVVSPPESSTSCCCGQRVRAAFKLMIHSLRFGLDKKTLVFAPCLLPCASSPSRHEPVRTKLTPPPASRDAAVSDLAFVTKLLGTDYEQRDTTLPLVFLLALQSFDLRLKHFSAPTNTVSVVSLGQNFEDSPSCRRIFACRTFGNAGVPSSASYSSLATFCLPCNSCT